MQCHFNHGGWCHILECNWFIFIVHFGPFEAHFLPQILSNDDDDDDDDGNDDNDDNGEDDDDDDDEDGDDDDDDDDDDDGDDGDDDVEGFF